MDLVRRAFEAFPRGDMEEMLSYADPEAELYSAIIGGAEGNVYRGHEELRRWYTETFESFEEVSSSGASFVTSAIASSPSGESSCAGARVEWNSTPRRCWIVTLRHGKLLKIEGS